MSHLAQLNIGRLRAPLESPEMADFVTGLDLINRLADAAPGFVWRMTTPGAEDNMQLRPYDDPTVAVNCSVWQSLAALREFVYRTGHLDYLRRRRDWFARMAEAYQVLWWVPAGHRPPLAEAMDRLEALRREGPSPAAFTFREAYTITGCALSPPSGSVPSNSSSTWSLSSPSPS